MAKRKDGGVAQLYGDIRTMDPSERRELDAARGSLYSTRLEASARGDMAGTPATLFAHPATYQQRVMRVWNAYDTDALFGRMIGRAVEFAANGSQWEVPTTDKDMSWLDRIKNWTNRDRNPHDREEDIWNSWADKMNSGVDNVLPGLDTVVAWAIKHMLLSGMFVPHWELGKMKFGKLELLMPTRMTCYPAAAITLLREQKLFTTETIMYKVGSVVGFPAYEGAPVEAPERGVTRTMAGMKELPQIGLQMAAPGVTEAFAMKYGWTPGDMVTLRRGQQMATGAAVYPRVPFFSLMPQFLMRQKLTASDLGILDGIINYIMCVRPDQLVTTRRGHIPIKDVQVGDEVLTHRARWRRVTQVLRRPHSGELIGLRPTSGMKGSRSCIWVTPEHPILSRHRKKYPYWDSKRQTYRWRVPTTVNATYPSWARQEPDPASWIRAEDVEGGDLMLLPRRPFGASAPITLQMGATHAVEVPGGLKIRNPKWRGGVHLRARTIPGSVQVDEAFAEVIGLYLAEGCTTSSTQHYSQWHKKLKLSPEQVTEVLASKESGRAIARRLGVTPIVISRIRTGKAQFKSRHGVSRRDVHGISFSFHERETGLHALVQHGMREVFGLRASIARRPGSHGIQLVFSSTIVGETFAREFGEGAANKRVPPWLLESAPAVTTAWIRGLFKGDGCRRPDGAWVLKIVSQELAYQAVDAIRALGMRASIEQYRGGTYRDGERQEHLPVYAVRTSNRDGFDVLMSGGLPEITTNEMWVTTRNSQREPYDGLVYNLEVEEDESYVVNGAAVHNCWQVGDKDHPPQPPEYDKNNQVIKDGTIAQVRKLLQEGRVGPALELFVPYYVNLKIIMPDTSALLSTNKYDQSTQEIFQAFGIFPSRTSRDRMEKTNVSNFEEFLAHIRKHVAAFMQMFAAHIVKINEGKLTAVPTWSPNPLNTKTEQFFTQLHNLASIGRVSTRTMLRYLGLDDTVELRRIARDLSTDADEIYDDNVPTSYVQKTTTPKGGGGDGKETETAIPPTKQKGRPKAAKAGRRTSR